MQDLFCGFRRGVDYRRHLRRKLLERVATRHKQKVGFVYAW